jgi:HPr kinase/phosphorylase
MTDLCLHATSIVLNEGGVLISGKPGSGKSSLALQLIDRGATLVSDDQTIITSSKDQLILSPPSSLKGLIEVRGVGICSFPYVEKAPLRLCVELCEENDLERLPDPSFVEYYGIQVPVLKLMKNDPLGMIKVELKVKQCPHS